MIKCENCGQKMFVWEKPKHECPVVEHVSTAAAIEELNLIDSQEIPDSVDDVVKTDFVQQALVKEEPVLEPTSFVKDAVASEGIPHQVSSIDIENNPELTEAGVVEGETITLPEEAIA